MNTNEIDPNTEASGAAMIAVLNCARGEQLRPIMDNHGLRNVQPDEWYPISLWMSVIEAITQAHMGAYDLIAIGKEIARNIVLSDDVTTVEQAIIHLPEVYQHNYRKGNVGHYEVQKIKNGHLKVYGYIPFPGDLTLGVLRGLVKRYSQKGKHYTVTIDQTDGANASADSDHFTFDVKWW